MAIESRCIRHLPASVLSVERLPFGNTNSVYKLVTAEGPQYLVREFGGSASLAFDRPRENEIYAALAKAGHAPQLVAAEEWGRIEGWVDGSPCSAVQCRQPRVFNQVAKKMAALHSFEWRGISCLSSSGGSVADTWGIATTKKWVASARELLPRVSSGESFISEEWLALHSESKLRERAQTLLEQLDGVEASLGVLSKALEDRPLALCYCHNDLGPSNVHFNDGIGSVQLIDFEFGGVNFAAFDLATHFCHWAGGAEDGRYSGPTLAFPTQAEQLPCLKAYAQEMAHCGTSIDIANLAKEVASVEPLAHACWGSWAACSLP